MSALTSLQVDSALSYLIAIVIRPWTRSSRCCPASQDVRTALAKMAVTHSTPTLQKAHNCLTRVLRHAEGRDLVRRNVSALVDTPHGREGRPSQAGCPAGPG
ncbi:MAG TPA: hypothetical protein VFQ68_42825 [Streptosporangiaceae bacterium]|nr:hypothetical protein [Streptosporangiaceae bacterium]